MDADRGKIATANKLFNLIDRKYGDIRWNETAIEEKKENIIRINKLITEHQACIEQCYKEIEALKKEIADL